METDSVTWNSTSYAIESLHISDAEGVSVNDFVYLEFTGTFPRTTGLVLEFAGGVMPLDDALGSGGRFQWGAAQATTYPSGAWGGLSVDDEVIVCLRTATQVCPGGNNPATGAPAVAGEAYVGKTLTAGPGDIADADGLTTPGYSYVWTRVDDDGETNPDSVGAGGTYTLVAADEGKKIKLTANFTDDGSESETRGVLFPSVGTVDPTPGSDVVWATTMTVAEASSDARGFDQQDGFGALVDSTFTTGTLSHEVEAMFVGPHNGTGYVAADDWVVFQLDIRLANSALADPDDYTLEFAGGAFPLSDATEDTDAVRQLLSFTKAWVASNASPLSETSYEATIPDGGTVNVLLRENPANPELEFDAATFNVAEDADSVEVKVKLSAAHTAEVTVDYATSDNTAIAGQDYTSRSGTLTFDPGDTEKTFHVPITDDAVYEPTQRFVVTLSDPSNADLGSQGSVAQVVITNDDAVPTASIADVSVGEGDGTMTLTLALSHLSEVATTYSTSTALVGGTATAGTDYTTFVPGTGLDFTVPAGDMSATLDITLTDDAVPEADETITVSWALSGSDATPASLSFTGTITDNDPVVVGYDPVTYSVDEDDGSVTLTLKVLDPASGGAPRAFIASVSTHDITALGGGGTPDYGGVSGQLVNFSVGDTDQTHSITIADDSDDEDDETFGSAVTVFSGLADVKEEADTATVTIVDNDGSTQNATGKPVITGPAQVGVTLEADTTAIADENDLGTFSYKWFRGSDEISMATGKTYVPVADDIGSALKVEVSFTDGASNPEKVTSDASSVVVPAAAENCSAANTVWCTTVTVGHGTADTDGKFWLGFGGDVGTADESFGTLGDSTFTIGTTEYTVTQVVGHTNSASLVFATNPELSGDGFTLHLQQIEGERSYPFSGAALGNNANFDDRIRDFAQALGNASETPATVTLLRGEWDRANDPYFRHSDKDLQFAIRLSQVTNNAAEGEPVITGPAQVDMELTAGTDDIDDDDGLNDVSYDYQWIRYDSDGTSNPDTLSMQTSSTYTLTSADLGKTLRVEVTFEDDADNPETLTSDATNPVVPAAAACGSDELWCAQLEVGYTEPDMDGEFDLGFRDATNGYGTLSDSTFTHNSVDYDVARVAGPSTGGGSNTLGFSTSPNLPADGAGLTLHVQTITGERNFPLSDYTLSSGIWQIDGALFADDVDDLLMLRSWSNFQGDYTRQTDEGTVFRVRLSAASGTPEVEFDDINVNVAEDAGSVALKVNLSAAQTETVTVNYATSDNTAVAGEDYTSTSGMLTFDPGDTEKTITVPILDDQSYGTAKRFNVTLSSASGADLGTNSGAQVTISNDEAVPTATMENVSVAEAAGAMALTLRLSHPSELATQAIAPSTGVGGTANEGTDYASFITGSQRILTVPAGDLSATLVITISDDDVPESDETITVFWDLSATAATPGAINFIGTILNDDAGNTAATGEPAIAGEPVVGLSLSASKGTIHDADGLANADNDVSGYAYTYQWIRVDGGSETPIPGATSSTYTLTDDDEGKRIKVRADFTDDEDNAESRTSDATATVEPEPEDDPTVTLQARQGEVTEGGTVRILLRLDPISTSQLSVRMSWSQVGSFWAGTPPSTVTVPAGTAEVELEVRTVDDNTQEANGSITARVLSGTGYEVRDDESVTTDVLDNDSPSGICRRTAQVRDRILLLLKIRHNYKGDCSGVTDADLAKLKSLDVDDEGITSLRSGDFAGLSSVTDLSLGGNRLSSLPAGIFDGMSSLSELRLSDNRLSSLRTGVFVDLPDLEKLVLNENNLNDLPFDDLEDLPSLSKLYWGGNPGHRYEVQVFPLRLNVAGTGNVEYRVRLKRPPGTSDRLVEIARVADGDLSVSPNSRSFSVFNWFRSQTFSVSSAAAVGQTRYVRHHVEAGFFRVDGRIDSVAVTKVASMTAGSSEDADVALLAGLSPREAAAVLFGEAELEAARLRALDRLGNGNGRYDHGDLVAWTERCRRGEADCGEGGGGDSGPGGSALPAKGLDGRARRRSVGGGQGEGPAGRPRRSSHGGCGVVAGSAFAAASRRRRSGWRRAAIVALLAAWACMGEDPTRPPDGAAGAARADRPLTVTLTAATPAASPAASAMLRIDGPAIDSVRAPGLTLFASGASVPGARTLVVAGDLSAGPVLEIWVPAGRDAAGYRVELLEVAGEDYGLRHAGGYRVVLRY